LAPLPTYEPPKTNDKQSIPNPPTIKLQPVNTKQPTEPTVHVPIQKSPRPQTNNKVTENQNKQFMQTTVKTIDQLFAANEQVAKQPANNQTPSFINNTLPPYITQSTLNDLYRERVNRHVIPLKPSDYNPPQPKFPIPTQHSQRDLSNKNAAKNKKEDQNTKLTNGNVQPNPGISPLPFRISTTTEKPSKKKTKKK
jgi:hypothetical protein